MESIASKFNKFFNGNKNFMTPSVIDYGRKGHMIYELSKGTGFKDQTIYAVTVLEDAEGGVKRPEGDLSFGGFESLEEAQSYIDNGFIHQ